MHFSIPDTQEFHETGSSYTGFNIHINGHFHCCLRYKQLHNLHEQLKRSLSTINDIQLPQFPPKKFLPLTINQLEERRIQLERYVQLIGQDPIISKLNLLQIFLLNAQQESSLIETREILLDVYLTNGYRIQINCLTTENSSKILSKLFDIIDLPQKYKNYFSLYLMRNNSNNDNNDCALVRKLMDFESPFISHRFHEDCQIVIRKCYWDSSYDLELMQDKVALNLLFVQTISDIERDWIIATNDTKEKLKCLQDCGNKTEFMDIARKLPCYGCLQFSNCSVDYPDENLLATIVIGNNELRIRTIIQDHERKIQETKFKVTRMRCWRVTTIHNSEEEDLKQKENMELSFEYLMNKNSLKWVTISSTNSMLISVCLQSMVDELINQKDGNNYSQKVQSINYTPLSYVRRDGGGTSRISESSSSDTISSLNDIDMPIQSQSESFSMRRRLQNKISTSVFFKNGRESVHNEAFEGIGDDDL